jgi:protocatechuate 3,4-dioxygenase alpha subunit
MRGPTPSQTVGPFFHLGLRRLFRDDLVPPDHQGAATSISGQVRDGDGQAVPDAVLEVWQADHLGRYVSVDSQATFHGWGRIPTDAHGSFRLRTITPGRVVGADGALQAPHINVTLFMRGLMRHLFTRVYFEGDPANPSDSVLRAVPEPRRPTLMAKRSAAAGKHYSWDVVLQGPQETVFFDW